MDKSLSAECRKNIWLSFYIYMFLCLCVCVCVCARVLKKYLALFFFSHTRTHTYICMQTAASGDLSQALAESHEQVSKMAEQNCRLLNELSPARQKV
jgi:hypothetical protein